MFAALPVTHGTVDGLYPLSKSDGDTISLCQAHDSWVRAASNAIVRPRTKHVSWALNFDAETESTMSKSSENSRPKSDKVYTPKKRKCLMCETEFTSSWPGERICSSCKSTHAWKDAGNSVAA